MSVLFQFMPRLLLWLLISSDAQAVAVSREGFDQLKNQLDRSLKQSGFHTSAFSIWVGMKEGQQVKNVYQVNSGKKMIPASLSKIVTAGASLEAFPVGTEFTTEIWADADIKNGTLEGAIYLKGGGDPAFVSENMWYLVNEFVRNDIHTIAGDLIVDSMRFDQVLWDKNRSPQRVDRPYDAPLSAMSFNWNSANFYIRPNKKRGAAAIVKVDPANDYVNVVNNATTGGNNKSLRISRRDGEHPKNLPYGDTYVVSGKIPLRHEEVVIYKSVTQPELWSGANLKAFLKRRGIEVKGKVTKGKTPKRARLLADAPSKSIASIVADMNKFSNNYVAEMLIKNLAAEKVGLPGTMEKGLKFIDDYLRGLGLAKSDYDFVSPSGFSRKNRLSARAMGKVLVGIQNRFGSQPEFLSSLPVSGVDGTLKRRMTGREVKRKIRAKTGLLNGAVGLAGYAGRQSGETLAFAFIFNGKGNEYKVMSLFDKMAGQLVH